MSRWGLYISILLIPLFLFTTFVTATETAEIFFNDQEISEQLDPRLNGGDIMVRARNLAEHLQAVTSWISALNTLTISRGDTVIKLMEGSSYIQVDSRSYKVKQGLIMINGSSYVPLKEVATELGFLYERQGSTIYLNKPETQVKGIRWQNGGKRVLIEMDKLAPYRVNPTDNSNELIIELDRVALAPDFKDGISSNDFYLKVNKVPNRARLQFSINSKYPLPFKQEIGLEEDGNNLLLRFLPQINTITFQNGELKITANGQLEEPETFLLQEPRRLVLDIPGLMLSDYQLELPENELIEDIRVSQFSYDPIVLRVVMELKEDSYLDLVESADGNTITLSPTRITRVANLKCEAQQLSFISDYPLKPDIFTLKDPERLVINIMNALKGDLAKEISVEGELIKGIRSSQFNAETVRIVVDLEKETGFNWSEMETEDGFKYTVLLDNSFEKMILADGDNSTNINISLDSSASYEVKKFSYPDRIAVDIEGINIQGALNLPEPEGLVKSVRALQLSDEPKIGRIVFELEEYHDHSVLSLNPDETISISLLRGEKTAGSDIIVLDPGHGGFDPGAIGPSGLMEKVVNLDISLKVRDILKREGYQVEMTRDDDTFLSLKERVELANQLDALIYVSIHANSSYSRHSEGSEFFIAPHKTADSLLLADMIRKEFIDTVKLYDRGIKRDDLYVIKGTRMPAVLVEVAFLSNSHEEALLESDLFRQKAAKAISEGIIKYLGKIK
ncbi:MAG TPA: N-acetylmuramoyl-L-alanine amidase [Halanaerobiales bacterium]|nr:N-acetylmuramoyl-L-alanine amidase [Halanaerobiales bacterium]